MKVYVLPADAYGCGHYRLIWPADVLKREGFDVTIIPPNEKNGFLVRTEAQDDGSHLLTDVRVPDDADVMVLQRPAHPLQPQMIRLLRSRGTAVVIDMDDDMSCIHPNNVAFHQYRPRHTGSPLSWQYTAASCKEASLVTTTTQALQRRYAKHGRGVVIDNYLPAAALVAEREEVGGFGWAGTTKSHPNDLQVMGKAVQNLLDAHMGPFKVVGGPSNVKDCARLRDEPFYTGTIGLDKWVKTISETYDVGLVPLAPGTFNNAKSSLKGKEHMAAGVPFVYSPREEYRRLAKASGCGLMAETPKDWFFQINRLLSSYSLRQEQAELGKCFMQDQTYQAQAWRWAEAWTRAYSLERSFDPKAVVLT